MNSTEKFWDTTYKNNIGKLIGTCYRYVQNRQLAEDLAHDAFITAINKANTYKGNGQFEAWLRRVVVNTALMHLRKKHADLYTDDLTMHENKAMELHDNEHEKGWIQQADFSREELLEAITFLPEHHKLVFNLYVIDGYTHQQIGNELGISAGTSKSHLARARKKLQQILNEKAQEKERKKDWKRALIILIWPGKSKAIDTLYKEKMIGFKVFPNNPIAIKSLTLGKAATPAIKAALISGKGAIIAAVSVSTISGSIYLNMNKLANKIKIETIVHIDDHIILTEPTDTIEIIPVRDTIKPQTKNDSLPKQNKPVVIKKQRIKHKPVVIKKAVIINDSTNEK